MTDTLYTPGQYADPADAPHDLDDELTCGVTVQVLTLHGNVGHVSQLYCTRPPPHVQHVACIHSGLVVACWDAL